MRRLARLVVPATVLGFFAVVLAGCDKKPDAGTSGPVSTEPMPRPSGGGGGSGVAEPASNVKVRTFDQSQLLVFAPLPPKIERPENPLTDDKVALGRQLYFDARLSRAQDVSCNTCHDVTKSGADTEPLAIGTRKTKGTRNTPTIFDAAGEFAQGWDGSSPLVEDFIVPHAIMPSVMGGDERYLVETLATIPGYGASFKKAFSDDKGAITSVNIAKALSAYARKLLTPGRWDTFLGGDASALTDEEKAGLGAFMDANCSSCHAGKYLGAAQNQKLGLAKPWPASTPPSTDEGRFAITKQDVDRFVFKVPTLRNVTKTAPYLHDGSLATLDEVVKLMARHQVGKELSDAQVKAIVAFLGALSGDAPKELVTKPDLPPSGPKTPKPG